MSGEVKLTEFSHGAGCGCKIAPGVLERILGHGTPAPGDPRLVVGNETRDDAAVYDMGNGIGVISTTDFFMPIVDDAIDFGRIAATNAISDVFAMGGKPLMAIAILGWPLDRLSAELAGEVIQGAREVCARTGIALAGGHSIDAPEPIFGLAVTGSVPLAQIKRNSTAVPGCRLYLTKPLGVGILTTAQKQKKIRPEHAHIAREYMLRLNDIGAEFATLPGVMAMTDVTGFGLAGHLLEICEGSGVRARLRMADIPIIDEAREYLALGCVPGGTERNFASYGHKLGPLDDGQKQLLCDPQTSGGLLVAVRKEAENDVVEHAAKRGTTIALIGETVAAGAGPLVDIV